MRQRLGDKVSDVVFERATLTAPALSPQHARLTFERTIGPVAMLVNQLAAQPERLAALRRDLDALIALIYEGNALHQHFLMTRARRV